ncbi:Uma2 family endonuclease [Nemorincola caseinilytica]|uniref:Uma2 family endonuclease n=1 Tax=Nemorincola caseinilytica TaxID=2054315 RepID=A0ABP8NCA4_9BACT
MLLADLDLNKTYTYADYFKWKLEERVELIRGRIFRMSPAPNRKHQQLTGDIFFAIRNFLKEDRCKVYVAPFDVRIPRRSKDDKDILTVLQPDICVICDPAKLDDRGCIGAPDLVVEVLSPGNNAKELKNKYEVYEESGVREYWVVSPQDQTLIIYTLTNGSYRASRLMVAGDIARSEALDGFSLDLTVLFEGLT